MAYLSPIPRRRDRKGAGTARILALLGRTYLAHRERRRAEKAAAAKAEMEAAEKADERGFKVRAEERAAERLTISKAELSRALRKDEYDRSRDEIEDLYRDARLANEAGDDARADEYLKLAKQREGRLTVSAEEARRQAAGGGSAGSTTEYGRGIALLEDLFVNNQMAPEQLPGRLPRILKMNAPGTKSPEDLAKLRETILFGMKPSVSSAEAGDTEGIGAGIDPKFAYDPRVSKWIDQYLLKYADILGIEMGAFVPTSEFSRPRRDAFVQKDPAMSYTIGADDYDDIIGEFVGE